MHSKRHLPDFVQPGLAQFSAYSDLFTQITCDCTVTDERERRVSRENFSALPVLTMQPRQLTTRQRQRQKSPPMLD
jgi:hypothetical protein